ncbi:response regulator [Ferruginibacter sp. SUN106]|uniref:sensor histidine kinase n=1 Tax=Ferruginibacter sp. SUN106 TaxID=2978348 RepID=UPI003D35F79F
METILKILHLEDTAFDAELVERELKKGGILFEKKVVDNGKDFEDALDNFIPDIILSDHSLPSFDSAGAIELVQKKCPEIPVILVTATVSEEFAVNILQHGAADYILKTNLNRLPSAVKKAIEKSRMIREREQAEEELKYSYLQIRKLASHLQNIREEERASMAREIHDELGQHLTALKLDVSWLSIKLKETEPQIVEKVKGMERLLTTSLITVKKLASELHPALLDKLGLIEAIRWQSREFEKRTGIKITLNLPEELTGISSKTNIALFRIYQESLTNVARHSGAATVCCSLKRENENLVFTITDDGKGFDVAETEQRHSLGLLGMKERSVMIGGKYVLSSEPGKGTKVEAMLPVNEITLPGL